MFTVVPRCQKNSTSLVYCTIYAKEHILLISSKNLVSVESFNNLEERFDVKRQDLLNVHMVSEIIRRKNKR